MQYSEKLLGLQNADGGWSYHAGGSWAEPTCYALLALGAGGGSHAAAAEVRRGTAWLKRCQRGDGGLAPRESVEQSTWLTALALLLPVELGGIDRDRAESWTVAQSGRESGWVMRLRLWMLGVDAAGESMSYDGWAWYPETAAWVGPTAISILALQKLAKRNSAESAHLRKRIEEGRNFLLARRCRDGGWNHGSTRALGYDSDSYPETTGLALLALHGIGGPEVERALARGEQHLAECRSSEAANWLRLGLWAHGRAADSPGPAGSPKDASRHSGSREPAETLPLPAMHGGAMEIALAAIVDSARAGRNPFLDA